MCLDDPLRDRQAEAGARDAGAACARCPEEGREHLREVALGDADAAVGYLQPRGGVVGVDPELDPASRRRELERVRDQVVENLSQARAVAVDQRCRVLDDVESDLSLCGKRLGGRRALACDRGQLELLQLEHELAGVDPGDEEEVVDEGEEPVGVAIEDLEEGLTPLGRRVGSTVDQQVEVAADRRQRRPKLV